VIIAAPPARSYRAAAARLQADSARLPPRRFADACEL
jgi:hypothetical protein